MHQRRLAGRSPQTPGSRFCASTARSNRSSRSSGGQARSNWSNNAGNRTDPSAKSQGSRFQFRWEKQNEIEQESAWSRLRLDRCDDVCRPAGACAGNETECRVHPGRQRRLGRFGAYGGTVPTPRIDKLAAEGMRFNNYNVEVQCTPSRSAIHTGRHPVRSGTYSVPFPGKGKAIKATTSGGAS